MIFTWIASFLSHQWPVISPHQGSSLTSFFRHKKKHCELFNLRKCS